MEVTSSERCQVWYESFLVKALARTSNNSWLLSSQLANQIVDIESVFGFDNQILGEFKDRVSSNVAPLASRRNLEKVTRVFHANGPKTGHDIVLTETAVDREFNCIKRSQQQ